MSSVKSFALCILILVIVAGSSAARAQCTAPSFSPDFTNNQSCLTLTGINYSTPSTTYPGFYPPVSPPPQGVATVLRLTPNDFFWAGSAWYNTQQPVSGAFSTTFTFQLSGTTSENADGFAFLIQNSTAATSALGPEGCGIGFGESSSGCTPHTGGGITNSLAVEFNTYLNPGVDTSGNDVTIQNCSGTGANSVDPICTVLGGANNNLPITLTDGNVHSATISYTPPLSGSGPGALDVILDGIDLFPGGGVAFDMTSIGLTNSNTAWVGFTAATGGGDDNQDILSWTFAPPSQSQAGPVAPGAPPTSFNNNGGFVEGNPNSGSTSTAQETDTQLTVQMVMTEIPTPGSPSQSQSACTALVQPSFPGAQCFVYQNGAGQGSDAALLYAVTCPPAGSCGSIGNPFDANLGSYFNFTCAENSPLTCGPVGSPSLSTSSGGNPYVGYLKGTGPDPNNPCTPYPDNNPPLFQSNQIISLNIGDTSTKPALGGSGGSTSCWVVTYLTPNEVPTVNVTQPQNNGSYQQNSTTAASYVCTAVNNGNSATGPYLTVNSCSAIDTPGGSVANGAQFDTSQTGPHTFVATVVDSALNTISSTVTYNVLGPQYITFPGISTQTYGTSFTVSATASSGLPVSFSSLTPAVCSVSGTTVTLIAVGTCTIQATQPATGSTSYDPATPVNQSFLVVAANTNTVVSSSLNPSTFGQAVSFTASVAEVLPASGIPTGTVQFVIDGTGAGTVPLSGTSATLTISTLAAGTHSVVANYSGDGNNNVSTGTLSGGQSVYQSPAITSANSTTFAAGVAGSFTVTASGFPSPAITESGTLPAGITFTGGTGSATLSGTTNAGGSYPISFTAKSAAGSVTQNFTLVVTGPIVTVSPTSVNLGTVYLYLDLNISTITVTNTGTTTLNISKVTLTPGPGTNSDDFNIIDNDCSATLAAGKSCNIYILFFSGNVGQVSATLNIADNAPGSPQQVTFSANVINPQASLSPRSLNFGTVKVKTHSNAQTVTLTNSGTTPLTISSISVTGSNAGDFAQSNACPSSLAAGAKCTISVVFTPTATGNRSANLTFIDNAVVGTQYVPLSGKGD